MRNNIKTILFLLYLMGFAFGLYGQGNLRQSQYTSRPAEDARLWQQNVRQQLFVLLRLDSLMQVPNNPLNPQELRSEDKEGYKLKVMEIYSTPGRRIQVMVTFPESSSGPFPAVVCIHGHGGELPVVYDDEAIYQHFARELASRGFVTIAAVVSQHEVFEEGQTLMGERLWDLMRCVDFLESREETDHLRMGCAGLSLGGEMAMWLGAMDTRMQATLSAGFLTIMDQMEQNHCMCWKFPGLRERVDFADIYSLIAPRPLMCQNGMQEPPDQFFVPLARKAFKEIETIYWDFKRPERLYLDVHEGGHEIDLPGLIYFFDKYLKRIPVN